MSTLPENELDLEKLFLPAWAQEPASAKQFANYEAREERPDRRGGDRPRRPGQRFGGQGGGDRSRQGGPGGGQFGQPRGDRRGPGGGPRREGGDKRPFNRDQRGPRRDDRREQRPETPLPLPEINLAFVPDETGVDSLARQIKVTGRAYPLFDIARLILQKPERHAVTFTVKKKDNQVIQPLFVCALDDTLWLSEDAAIAHVLNKHFATFYQTERTATEPPKGKYTFVAQCGMSGVILGPPNHHDYQNQLRKLHAERFSRMPFDMFKSRVKIVRDEEVIKKWTEDQSWKTEYVCLNMPEPLRLDTREAVEKHFRETHKETIIKQVESHTISGVAARNLRAPELVRLVRQGWEDQRRFPLQLATLLSQKFASYGLQFFKVNKAITHVSVARPHYLDLEVTPVSEGVKRIVDFVNATPKCTRRKLMEALAPTPKKATPAPLSTETPAQSASETPAETAAAPAPAVEESTEPTPEQTTLIADLHWLIHQGHVIEFANGIMETAKKPLPKPPKTPKPEPKAAETAEQKVEGTAAPESASVEASPETSAAEAPSAEAAAVPDLSSEQPTSQLAPEAVVEPTSEVPPETPGESPA
ncbi:MAG TPA: hypothetical protein VFW05_03120 [Verrucomicrobiae bacterium]|nr:hypothetical protein [Verrucomicrobiae bacterium]